MARPKPRRKGHVAGDEARLPARAASRKQWLSFNVREDHLNPLAMGNTVSLMRNGADGATKAVVTELRPIGVFSTWQAERVIGDHDRNTPRLPSTRWANRQTWSSA